ncbi:ER membrane protein complex subunit 2 [Lamellibrachia satsuma]|nr:ER membrane protein complex subunit 2 [Lamellibrachia satsuma]
MASSMTWEEAREKLSEFREDRMRNSEEVVEMWQDVLADFSYKLGDELWIVYEQVCIAACDCHQRSLAETCVTALKRQFPSSCRVHRLEGLLLESEDDYEGAMEIYQEMLKDDPTNSLVRKRVVSVLKEQNKIAEAIKELNNYLKDFMSDTDSWMELCDLYLSEQDYGKAAFCIEELILSNPRNHLFHQKFAEVKYTQGGQDNMECACKYFAQAIKLNPSNMRALFGLLLTASTIASSQKANAKSKKDAMKYATWATQQISLKYKESPMGKTGPNLQDTVSGMLDTLQITQGT